jgi:hypothetical protein
MKTQSGVLPIADNFNAKKAVEYWIGNNKPIGKELLNKLLDNPNETELDSDTRAWLITMALENSEITSSIDGAQSELVKVLDKFNDELAKQTRPVSLQDSKGGRVDFSANPKALFAPPRDASEADLGEVDIGVLGDAYICGLGSSHKHKWVLLPSCLQRFAYELLFRDSSVARLETNTRGRSKKTRFLLF